MSNKLVNTIEQMYLILLRHYIFVIKTTNYHA